MRVVFCVSVLLGVAYSCQKSDSSGSQSGNAAETASDPEDPEDPSNPGDDEPKGGTQAGTLQITATLPTGSEADTAVSFQVSGSQLDNVQGGEPTQIQGGTLAIAVEGGAGLLDDGGSTVIMVLKEGESRLDAFDSMQFVGGQLDGNETLLNLATSDAKVDKIDLGKISADGNGDLIGQKEIGTGEFEVKAEALSEMAQVDDAIRVLKNQYANSDPASGGSISGVLEFYWRGSVPGALDQEHDPQELEFIGWSPALHVNRDDFTFEALCDKTSDKFREFSIALPEPGAKRGPAEAYETSLDNSDATINEDGRSCASGNSYIAGGTSSNPSVFMNFGGGSGYIAPIPEGVWQVQMGGKTVGKFDLALSYPMVEDPADAEKIVPRVYVPAIKIVRGSSDAIIKIEIWFYLYDRESRTYEKVASYETMKKTVEGVEVSMDAFLGENTRANAKSVYLPESAGKTFPADGEPWVLTDFSDEWQVKSTDLINCPDPSGYYRADSISVDYILFDNRYKFTFELPEDFMATCP